MITIGTTTLAPEVFGIWAIIISFSLYRLGVIFLKYTAPLRKKNIVGEPTGTPVSIIIPARNCAEELKKNLPHYLTQDYAEYEVIVVDQCSNDDTLDVLSHLKEKYPHLKVTGYSQQVNFTRKLNFFLGLKASSYDWAIFMSPYSQPENDKWLYNLSAGMQPDKDMLFFREEHDENRSVMDALAKAQFFFRDFNQLAHVSNPLIYNTENVAFRKEKITAFFKANNPNYAYPMVENMLNKAAVDLKASYHPSLVTYDKQCLNWKDLINIRENQLFIRKNLRARLRIHLCFDEVSRIILLVAFALGLTLENGILIVSGIASLLIMSKSWIIYKIKTTFNFQEFLIYNIYDFASLFSGVFLRSRIQLKRRREKWT